MMRKLILNSAWTLLVLVAAVHDGLATTYRRLCGEWLEPDDGCDVVERVDLAKTRAR